MPKKAPGEGRAHYVSRFMKSDYSKDAPAKQRLAIAYSEYKQQSKKKARKHK